MGSAWTSPEQGLVFLVFVKQTEVWFTISNCDQISANLERIISAFLSVRSHGSEWRDFFAASIAVRRDFFFSSLTPLGIMEALL